MEKIPVSKLPKWLKVVIYVIVGLATAVGSLVAFTNCTTTHRVTQSSFNTSTGDSIVIRYEQVGSALKR